MTPSLRLRLLEALEPFVREAFRYEPPEGDDDRKAFETNLRIGQVRDLARLHDELKGGDASDTDGPTLARTGRYATPPPSASEPAGAMEERIASLTASLAEARRLLEKIADREITWTVGTAFDSFKGIAGAFLSSHPEKETK